MPCLQHLQPLMPCSPPPFAPLDTPPNQPQPSASALCLRLTDGMRTSTDLNQLTHTHACLSHLHKHTTHPYTQTHPQPSPACPPPPNSQPSFETPPNQPQPAASGDRQTARALTVSPASTGSGYEPHGQRACDAGAMGDGGCSRVSGTTECCLVPLTITVTHIFAHSSHARTKQFDI